MKLYLVDTNTDSHFVKEHPDVVSMLLSKPIEAIAISAITEGELRFGLAKRPGSKRIIRPIEEFMQRAASLPWDSRAAFVYGTLRAALEKAGKGIGSLDLLIAAHAMSVDGILVTADKAFRNVPGLAVEDWTQTI